MGRGAVEAAEVGDDRFRAVAIVVAVAIEGRDESICQVVDTAGGPSVYPGWRMITANMRIGHK